MVAKEFLLIANEPHNDELGAELVHALRQVLAEVETGYTDEVQPLHSSLEPKFYGAGGPKMAAVGVHLPFDFGTWEPGKENALQRYLKFRRAFRQLYEMALAHEPHVIIFVGLFGFNLRFARAIKKCVGQRERTFNNWDPRIIQYAAPELWASRLVRRPGSARPIDLFLGTGHDEEFSDLKSVPYRRVKSVAGPLTDHPSAGFRPALDSDLRAEQVVSTAQAEAAWRAARAIVELIQESEVQFPLRAHLSR